jgi:hypothetical protein
VAFGPPQRPCRVRPVFGMETGAKRWRAEAHRSYIGLQPEAKIKTPVNNKRDDSERHRPMMEYLHSNRVLQRQLFAERLQQQQHTVAICKRSHQR